MSMSIGIWVSSHFCCSVLLWVMFPSKVVAKLMTKAVFSKMWLQFQKLSIPIVTGSTRLLSDREGITATSGMSVGNTTSAKICHKKSCGISRIPQISDWHGVLKCSEHGWRAVDIIEGRMLLDTVFGYTDLDLVGSKCELKLLTLFTYRYLTVFISYISF